MIKINKILNDNFAGLLDAMDGDKDLAHFYRSLAGVCIQEYALELLETMKMDSLSVGVINKYCTLVEKEKWD